MPFIELSRLDEGDGLVGHLHEQVGLLLQLRHRGHVAVPQLEPVADLHHVVDDVVELLGEGMDVLPIERRDERGVQPPEDLADQLVAALLARDDGRETVLAPRRASSRSRRAQSATLAAASLNSAKNRRRLAGDGTAPHRTVVGGRAAAPPSSVLGAGRRRPAQGEDELGPPAHRRVDHLAGRQRGDATGGGGGDHLAGPRHLVVGRVRRRRR